MEHLKEVISLCSLTQALPDKEVKQVLQAMRGPHHVLPGMEIIRQGMSVDADSAGLYILESGHLSAYVCSNGAQHPGALVQEYTRKGQYFGELALVFKCPRSATIAAETESTLWSLDKGSFNHLLREGFLGIRERCKNCAAGVAPNLPKDISEMIADGMQLRTFEKGQLITSLRRNPTEGDQCREFFIMESGHAVSSSSVSDAASRRYSPADVFGTPWGLPERLSECDVFAGASPTVCAVLNAQAVERLLGAMPQLLAELSRPSEILSETSSMGKPCDAEGVAENLPRHVNEVLHKQITPGPSPRDMTSAPSWWQACWRCGTGGENGRLISAEEAEAWSEPAIASDEKLGA
jgi:CRP-like cAMP-binding protein